MDQIKVRVTTDKQADGVIWINARATDSEGKVVDLGHFAQPAETEEQLRQRVLKELLGKVIVERKVEEFEMDIPAIPTTQTNTNTEAQNGQ